MTTIIDKHTENVVGKPYRVPLSSHFVGAIYWTLIFD
jgi:hypothetical protein